VEYQQYAECLPRGMLGCHCHYYQYQSAAMALLLCALMSISSALFGSSRVRSFSEFVFYFDPKIWDLNVLDQGAIFGNA
jgi:hypothetical protein